MTAALRDHELAATCCLGARPEGTGSPAEPRPAKLGLPGGKSLADPPCNSSPRWSLSTWAFPAVSWLQYGGPLLQLAQGPVSWLPPAAFVQGLRARGSPTEPWWAELGLPGGDSLADPPVKVATNGVCLPGPRNIL